MTLDSVHTRTHTHTHTCVLKRHSKWIALLLLLLSIYPEHAKSFVDSSSSYVLSMPLIRRFRVIILLKHVISCGDSGSSYCILQYLKHAPSCGDRGSSHVLCTPPHEPAACGPRPGRPAARLKQRLERTRGDQGTRGARDQDTRGA